MRDELKRRSRIDMEDNLSASSIKHTVSHLLGFFDWLLKQDGYRRLPRDFDGYLKLPKAVVAQSAQVKKRDFPTILEAEDLLKAMPTKSLVDERARALFALGFLGALRADTLISLRLEHFDIERRLILQHAKIVRAKAGKSLDIFWFPIPKVFEETVIGWVNKLKTFGFTDQDALFPDTKHLKHRVSTSAYTPAPVPVMSTIHAVTKAFAVACSQTGAKYTPHCVKHSIGALRDSLPLTQEERKAWSLNMGHDDERTTERYYGTMQDDQRFEVLENIGTKKTIDTLSLTTDQKARAFDAMIKAIGE
ncbi:site-specific integrase [Planktotalea sp.]|uniref:tyrosine-type recombinase/integrase n=1 Tax=Planktotalea sp. TaxID=2029877 RepID=UPI003299663E